MSSYDADEEEEPWWKQDYDYDPTPSEMWTRILVVIAVVMFVAVVVR